MIRLGHYWIRFSKLGVRSNRGGSEVGERHRHPIFRQRRAGISMCECRCRPGAGDDLRQPTLSPPECAHTEHCFRLVTNMIPQKGKPLGDRGLATILPRSGNSRHGLVELISMAALHARLHWSAAVAVVLLAVTVGCSSGGEDSAASEAAATTRQVPDTGKFVLEYQDAGLSEMSQAGHDIARDNEVIEELAKALGEIYRFPKDVPIIGVECGGFGVIWDFENDWMVLCYEMFTVAEDYARLQAEGRADNSDLSFDGVTRMITFHGSGHMAIDLYSLPSTGGKRIPPINSVPCSS